MNKILRYSFMALLAMVGLNISAQEVTIDFSGSEDVWGIGTTKLVDTQSFTYNGLTIKLTGTTGNGYRWYDSGNIILGKQGATLEFPAFDFDVDRIEIVGTSGASASVKQNIFVGEEAVSSETTGAKDVTNQYLIAEGKQAAGTIYTLKVTSNHNTQITKIMIYKKGSASSVAQPEFSVASGLYFEPQTVALTCETEGAKILYTIPAGEDPVYTDDENYTGVFYDGTPLTITKNTIIKAMAVKDGQTSSIVTAKYTIVNTTGKGTEASPFSVADALQVIGALDNGQTTTETYFVKGYIVGTPDFQRNNEQVLYGNCNFDIADAKGGSDKLTIFRAKSFDNQQFTEENVTEKIIDENDLVTLVGKLQKYVKDEVVTPELSSCYLISVEKGGSDGITNVNAAKAENAVRYNLAGQKVNNGFKGVVIMNGKKMLQK